MLGLYIHDFLEKKTIGEKGRKINGRFFTKEVSHFKDSHVMTLT